MTASLPLAWCALVLGGAWSIRPRVSMSVPPVRVAAAVIGIALVVAMPALWIIAALGAAALFGAPALASRRARRARRDAIVRALPEIVDLLHLAVGAGLTVPLAVEAVVHRATGPLADELAIAIDDVGLGRRLGDALSDVPARAGESVRPLVAALVASDRYGAPLADALGRLAADVRADRRRRAEEAARRVPVKLLFPLVCCVLPAFGLLTLAPLIAGAVAALRL